METLAQAAPPDAPTIVEHEVQIPPFPRLLGPLGRLADAITADIPYEFKALAVVTCVGLALSGRIHLASDPWMQTRFYSLTIGKPSGGKTAAWDEVIRALRPIVPYAIEYSIDSGPALVDSLCENNYLFLFPDEMSDLFEKAKRRGSTLFSELLRLYEKNFTANRVRKDKKSQTGGRTLVTNGHFAIGGGVTDESFLDMWQGSGANKSGLRSRFSCTYSDAIMPRLKTPNNDKELTRAVADIEYRIGSTKSETLCELAARSLTLSTEAQDALLSWRPGQDGEAQMQRALDKAKRFSLLNAFCAGKAAVDAHVMKLGLDFADHCIAVEEKLFEPDAASYVQAFENRIIKFFAANPRATESQVRQAIRPEKCKGGHESFNRAWRATEKLRIVAGHTRKKEPVFGWKADEKAA